MLRALHRHLLLFLNDLGSKFASSSAIGKTLANAFMSPPSLLKEIANIIIIAEMHKGSKKKLAVN